MRNYLDLSVDTNAKKVSDLPTLSRGSTTMAKKSDNLEASSSSSSRAIHCIIFKIDIRITAHSKDPRFTFPLPRKIPDPTTRTQHQPPPTTITHPTSDASIQGVKSPTRRTHRSLFPTIHRLAIACFGICLLYVFLKHGDAVRSGWVVVDLMRGVRHGCE